MSIRRLRTGMRYRLSLSIPLRRACIALLGLGALGLLGACGTTSIQPDTPVVISSPGAAPSLPVPPDPQQTRLEASDWHGLPGWSQDNALSAWSAFRSSCLALVRKSTWQRVCRSSESIDPLDSRAIQRFFETNFVPYAVVNDDGSTTGTITGYYEPILRGSRTRHGPYQVPLHRLPTGLSKAQLTQPRATLLGSGVLKGHELVWVDDPVEAAYLQIQGSGLIELDDGTVMRVGFAGTNERAFNSFSRWLLDRRQITPAQATMPGIRAWAKSHPQQVEQMLNVNPRYIYFRELPPEYADPQLGPIGALGVPLTAERSIAVDPSKIPLGAPVFLSTTRPYTSEPLQRLMVAQDTGSAIKGAVRADFFWGRGDSAGESAGRMKQNGQLWVLMPNAR
ncbi:murein transglycosylase A [Halotalea alkalilenta]|uniref:murein transglycosylase A n=1 Tax=Halotalea alkalilenta TaxID=376489 RepID=UPI001FE04CAF|nr:MltA domain-containing protein [Halotalea alkalilenta]